MKISVTVPDGNLYSFEVSEDLELENFKALCEIEVNCPVDEILLTYNGKPLVDNNVALKDFGVKDGDVISLVYISSKRKETSNAKRLPFQIDFGGIRVPDNVLKNAQSTSTGPNLNDHLQLLRLVRSNPNYIEVLRAINPQLATAVENNDLDKFGRVLKNQMVERKRIQDESAALSNRDLLDPEVQRIIAKKIERDNIDENMEAAIEHLPETFGSVLMLYVKCKVNGNPLVAFIDSGAQATIMSDRCANRCNITRLIDKRWTGIAKGVGVSNIIGRVHLVQITIENDHLPSAFCVLEDQEVDLIIGLDMLKSHQCVVDLKRNVLRIGTTGTETPFLSEKDLPECYKITTAGKGSSKSSNTNLGTSTSTAQNISGSVEQSSLVTEETSSVAISDQILPSDNFTQDTVDELVGFGFSRQAVFAELREFGGNKVQAIAALFAKSIKY